MSSDTPDLPGVKEYRVERTVSQLSSVLPALRKLQDNGQNGSSSTRNGGQSAGAPSHEETKRGIDQADIMTALTQLFPGISLQPVESRESEYLTWASAQVNDGNIGQNGSSSTQNDGYSIEGVSREEIKRVLDQADIMTALTQMFPGMSWQPVESRESEVRRLIISGIKATILFERTGAIKYIDEAIKNRTRALYLTPPGHIERSAALDSLGSSYRSRFARLGELADLDKAIDYGSQAVLLTADGHSDKPCFLGNLGSSLTCRFERLGEQPDLDKSIECYTQALSLTPDGHEDKSVLLGGVGNSYSHRFASLGEVADIDKAIEYQTQLVLFTPDGHAGKPMRLARLGNSHQHRFENLGELADINKALECHNQAVLLSPDDNHERPCHLCNLGTSYMLRFSRLGELPDLDQGVECHTRAVLLFPDNHASKPMSLTCLGNSSALKFERYGQLEDLHKANEFHTQAVLLTPDGHAGKPGLLDNLGKSHLHLFKRLGGLTDADKAVECRTKALMLTPEGHAGKPSMLNGLAEAYIGRFERLGEHGDLNKAIDCQREAILLTPDGHAQKPARLGYLGASSLQRFESLGNISDIHQAIVCLTQALLLTPDDHPDKSARLNNLGGSYLHRFERLGELTDLENSIKFITQAVLLTPDRHEVKPSRLNNLGCSYRCRFERLGEHADMTKAIQYHSQAVLLTPDGHPRKPQRLHQLGALYWSRFKRAGTLQDAELARSNFQQAAQLGVTVPTVQLKCAREWARLSSLLGLSPQLAYETCMQLIPHLIWLGSTIDRRYSLLTEIRDLATEAAAWAISAHSYDLAIEWLEEGRSIVWNQVLQLRTPFEDLSAVAPLLVQSLKDIASQLEGAGSREETEEPLINGLLDLEKGAQRHRQLALEWEKLLAQARKIPGFHNFMRPRKADELKLAATDGPVILINTHSTRCDALIIFPECDDVAHLPLENFSADKVGKARAQLDSLTGHRGDRIGGFKRLKPVPQPENPFKVMLATLWSEVVKPVVDALGCSNKLPVDELPHVTWCTTGVLSFLPLHAAGPYDDSQPNAFDLVISSYTPTLSALLAPNSSASNLDFGVLAVGQEHTPGFSSLPSTVKELTAVKEHTKTTRFQQLKGANATVPAVLGAMEQYSWVHLACHATQNRTNPAQSAFHLHESNLTLQAITKRSFKNKGLAFLSACQTAAGDNRLPDESIHLAAGMLMAGYPSVIATMWSILDEDAPGVAGQVYAGLLKDGRMDYREAARALHKSVVELREKVGYESFERWVPFIHIGV